jgi:hypothetical protein
MAAFRIALSLIALHASSLVGAVRLTLCADAAGRFPGGCAR